MKHDISSSKTRVIISDVIMLSPPVIRKLTHFVNCALMPRRFHTSADVT